MIGVVLVTHGRLAEEFLAAVEHVVGPQTHFAAISIGADDDMDQRRQEIIESAKEVDMGDGIILLTDMFGGTPSNMAISLLDQDKIDVIAGVNLPMLIKLVSIRAEKSLPEVVEESQEA
ncbi:MAG TPA: PTS fructose transporter subunit IIA, partial [Rhodospirillaceae bacterium]|nr:PTS fructose transporter subunit IIA [Rhodospirillaceae bacterium]